MTLLRFMDMLVDTGSNAPLDEDDGQKIGGIGCEKRGKEGDFQRESGVEPPISSCMSNQAFTCRRRSLM